MIKKTIGVYAPLTARDNVMVDNVLDMCYSQIDSQVSAQLRTLGICPCEVTLVTEPQVSHRCS